MQREKASWIRIINWLLYSNVFIACCALAMTAQTLVLLEKEIMTSPALLGLVFFSTWFIYALHRLVSLYKLNAQLDIPRFQIINHYQKQLKVYIGIAALMVGICFFYLNPLTKIALLLPAFLSLGYVLPFIGNKQLRLRDVHFVKIFLIAIVWAYVTVLLPELEVGENAKYWGGLMGRLFERALFIFVITLPFDLRDWKLDEHHAVKTIAVWLGPKKTINLAIFLLVVWLLLVVILYAFPLGIGYILAAGWTALLLWRTLIRNKKLGAIQIVADDYYYTGLIDGTILVQALLVIGITML